MTYLDICVVSMLLGIVAFMVAREVFVKPVFAVIDNSESNLKGLCCYLMASGRNFYQAWFYLKREEVEIRKDAIKHIRDVECQKISRFLMQKKERERYDKFLEAFERSKDEAKTAELDYERFGKAV